MGADIWHPHTARQATASSTEPRKIYAHCIDGQADAANKRISDGLGSDDTCYDQGQDDQAS